MAVDLPNSLNVNSSRGESLPGASAHDASSEFSAAQGSKSSARPSARSTRSNSSTLGSNNPFLNSNNPFLSNNNPFLKSQEHLAFSRRSSIDEHFGIEEQPADKPAAENVSPMLRELHKAQLHFDAAMSGTDAEGGQRKLDPANGGDVAAFLARQPGGLVDSHQAMSTYRTHQENHFALMQEKGLNPESAEDISRYMDTLESDPAAAQQPETAAPQAAKASSEATEAEPAPQSVSVSALARNASALVEAYITAEKRDDTPAANALVPQIQKAVGKVGGKPADLLAACFSAQTRAQLQASSRQLNNTLKLLSELDEGDEDTTPPPSADDHNMRQIAVGA